MAEIITWDSFDKFNWADDKYLPPRGEGETMASQAVTAIAKLVYKWFNDGDVYDNTHTMYGWCNDISSFANWLYHYVDGTKPILKKIYSCQNDEQYESILYELCEFVETEEKLSALNDRPKFGSVYDCDAPFKFIERDDDYDNEDY